MDVLALQIAQALFRVCNYIKQKDLRGRIEAHSVYLLESATTSDNQGVERSIITLEKLVLLGEAVGEIHYQHAQIIRDQFTNLKSLLLSVSEREQVEIAIADIFTGDYEKYTKSNSSAGSPRSNAANRVVEMRVSQSDSAKSSHFHYPAKSATNRQNAATPLSKILQNETPESKNGSLASPIASNAANRVVEMQPSDKRGSTEDSKPNVRVSQSDSAKSSHFHYPANGGDPSTSSGQANGNTWQLERQELVAQKIKELGKAAMKDLIAAFPEVSERTLRYDLQKLSERQIVERIGNGGPASYYRVKNSVFARDLRLVRE